MFLLILNLKFDPCIVSIHHIHNVFMGRSLIDELAICWTLYDYELYAWMEFVLHN